MSTNINTESLIMQSAEKLFLEKGYAATSTVEIAKVAGCNQALVHYYFRSKENLFKQIFRKNFDKALALIVNSLSSQYDCMENLRRMIDAYFTFLEQNEKIPALVVREVLLDGNHFEFAKTEMEGNSEVFKRFAIFDKAVRDEVAKGRIRKIGSIDLLMDIISLCASVFIAQSMLQKAFNADEDFKKEYYAQRKKEIIELVVRGIRP